MIDIKWCILKNGNMLPTMEDFAYFEPEKVLTKSIRERPDVSSSNEFRHCPAHRDYFRNAFLIRCPAEIKLRIDPALKRVTDLTAESETKRMVHFRSIPGVDSHLSFSIMLGYLFYTDKDTVMELIPAFFEHDDITRDFLIVPGEYNISKWIRSVEAAIELRDGITEFSLKRGDPLFYVRFRTKNLEPARLQRVKTTEDLISMSEKCVHLKDMIRGLSLDEAYALAKDKIKAFFKKQKKCPFGFGKE